MDISRDVMPAEASAQVQIPEVNTRNDCCSTKPTLLHASLIRRDEEEEEETGTKGTVQTPGSWRVAV